MDWKTADLVIGQGVLMGVAAGITGCLVARALWVTWALPWLSRKGEPDGAIFERSVFGLLAMYVALVIVTAEKSGNVGVPLVAVAVAGLVVLIESAGMVNYMLTKQAQGIGHELLNIANSEPYVLALLRHLRDLCKMWYSIWVGPVIGGLYGCYVAVVGDKENLLHMGHIVVDGVRQSWVLTMLVMLVGVQTWMHWLPDGLKGLTRLRKLGVYGHWRATSDVVLARLNQLNAELDEAQA